MWGTESAEKNKDIFQAHTNKAIHPKTPPGRVVSQNFFCLSFFFAEAAEIQNGVCVYFITAEMEGPVQAAATLLAAFSIFIVMSVWNVGNNH